MSLVEFKNGARWVPGTGFNPDPAGLRTPPVQDKLSFALEAAYAVADLSPLIAAIALQSALLGAIYVFFHTATAMPGGLFTVADLIVPAAIFLVLLTGRRYGPGRAITQLIAALLLCGAALLAEPSLLHHLVRTAPAMTARTMAAFALAFVLANGAAIAIFECARGPVWWKAPAYGAAAAAMIFCGIFYPLMREDWLAPAAWHVAQMGLESALLLLPYWLLRGAIKPLPGFNGY